MGFGNTVPPPKREEDFLSSAVSSLCSVRTMPCPTGPWPAGRLRDASPSLGKVVSATDALAWPLHVYSLSDLLIERTLPVNRAHVLQARLLCGTCPALPSCESAGHSRSGPSARQPRAASSRSCTLGLSHPLGLALAALRLVPRPHPAPSASGETSFPRQLTVALDDVHSLLCCPWGPPQPQGCGRRRPAAVPAMCRACEKARRRPRSQDRVFGALWGQTCRRSRREGGDRKHWECPCVRCCCRVLRPQCRLGDLLSATVGCPF